jgi:hypothetical protein
MRRNSLFLGAVLLILGGLMLADAYGIRFPSGAKPSDFFFPALLVLLGAALIFGVFRRGKVETERASIDLQGASEANLTLSHGAGRLKVHAGAASGLLVSGTFAGGLRHTARKSGDRLEVRMRPAHEAFFFPFFGSFSPLDWDVALSADTRLTLKLESGANQAEINLRDLRVTDLKLDTGASDTKLVLPARGRVRADLDFGASSMDITIPDGVSARIRIDQGISDVKVDGRFPLIGGMYKSADFETAANAVDLDIDAGAANIRIH